MFAISNSLSKSEAISFAKTINTDDKYYIVCVHRNPKVRHIEKLERYVIVRDLRKGEIVWDGIGDDKRRVRIGVYVIFLEATDRSSGKVLTAKKVTVVATKL
jgi:hypothetical protein